MPTLLAALVMFCAASRLPLQAPVVGTEKEIRSLVESAVGLLEKKNYAQFLQQCVSPSDRARREKELGGPDKALQAFAVGPEPANLLRMLIASRKAKFALDRAGNGFFVLVPAVDGKSRLALSQHRDKWYLY